MPKRVRIPWILFTASIKKKLPTALAIIKGKNISGIGAIKIPNTEMSVVNTREKMRAKIRIGLGRMLQLNGQERMASSVVEPR